MDFLQEFLLIFTTFFISIYAYFYYAYQYWEKRKFPFIPPSFPLGNSSQLIKKSKNFNLESMKFYDEVKKRGLKFAGIYTVVRPVLVVIDPDYIRDILAKNFYHFTDRGFYYNAKDDPTSAHLFALDGYEWKNMRNHLTPTFTSGKMKAMFSSVLRVSDFMVDYINKIIETNADIDIRECLAKFTTDSIGCCAFGIDCNCFKYPNSEFREMGKKIFQPKDIWHVFANLIAANLPELGKKLGFKAIREDVSAQCKNLVEQTIRYRQKNNTSRPDFLQLVMEMEKEGAITMEQLVAQVFVFFVAGFDTSTTAMNFALYEVARNPEVQEKVRQEINNVLAKHNDQITYDSIKEMTYLQQVFDETLRLYPSVPNLQRVCVKEYTLRDTDLVLEKGTQILIPLISLHRDPDYYPDPLKFDPDRFSPENKKARQNFVHMPFGEGPRNCIGLRFGQMQSKIGVVKILKNFRVKISPKMKKPLTLDPRFFLLAARETLYLTIEKIK